MQDPRDQLQTVATFLMRCAWQSVPEWSRATDVRFDGRDTWRRRRWWLTDEAVHDPDAGSTGEVLVPSAESFRTDACVSKPPWLLRQVNTLQV